MDTIQASAMSKTPRVERRQKERFKPSLPAWLGKRTGSEAEVAALQEALNANAQQMAQLRNQNQKLMIVNSDLRCRLGEVTLQWVDACNRQPR